MNYLEDIRVWIPDQKGKFSVKSAFESIRIPKTIVNWHHFVWNHVFHPKDRSLIWRIATKSVASDDRLKRITTQLASKCWLCGRKSESLNHIMWSCAHARAIWVWSHHLLCLSYTHIENLTDAIHRADHCSSMIREVWYQLLGCGMSELWKARNEAYWNGIAINQEQIRRKMLKFVREREHRLQGHIQHTAADMEVLDFFGLQHKFKQIRAPIQLTWDLPETNQIKLCSDGAIDNNTGNEGAAAVLRDSTGVVLVVATAGLGQVSNYRAELEGILLGMKCAAARDFKDIWISTD